MAPLDPTPPDRPTPRATTPTGPTGPQLAELADRTHRSLVVLRWLLLHHEARDGTPLGLPSEQLARIRGEAERLIEAFDQLRTATP